MTTEKTISEFLSDEYKEFAMYVIEGRAILKAAAHPLIEQVDTMDGAANRAAELAAK